MYFQKIKRIVLLTVVMLIFVGIATASDKKNVHNDNEVVAADPTYVIGPDDVLNINVWHEPELSVQAIPVRPDGKISLALLSDIQAAGLTPNALTSEITEKLKKFVNEPQVTVVVKEINSKRIYLVGNVTRSGAYPLVPNMTVLEAISSAGGLQQFANAKKIYVLRKMPDGSAHKMPYNYKKVISGKRPDEGVLLQAGDTVVVP